MYLVNLDKIPNQTFNVMLDNVDYRVALRSIKGLTYMSLWANGELLFYNQLCTPNAPVNPYRYVSINGRFCFACDTDDYPYYTQFGETQQLYFITQEEIDNA